MQSQIISIGDELLRGDTANTNARWLGETLAENGAPVTAIHTIRDDKNTIKAAINKALQTAGLAITTGGLGPTDDDLTKQSVAELFDVPMMVHQPTLSFIKETFKKRNIPFTSSNYYQAEVPKNAEVLFNKQGTAPGLWFERNGSLLAVLPGIPHEMKALTENEILPRIRPLTNGNRRIFSRHIKVAGIGESTLSDEVLGPLDEYLSEDISVAFLPSPRANAIRIDTRTASASQADEESGSLRQYMYEKAGSYIIGEGRALTISEAVGKVLRDHSLTIAAAESCTGGLLASRLTDIPGSSDYLAGGLTAYANSVKKALLDVSEEALQKHGAVSKTVALQMAKAVAAKMHTDIGVSTTGIAGPEGGTEEKPVGTVWIGFWSADHHFALKACFSDDRLINKERSVASALETVRRTVLGIEPMPYGLKPHYG
jgi:nicotinamide-nucleotide amidase